MYLINILLLIAAGILAISGLIVAKKPNAKELIDKLVPYQAIIGIAALIFGIVNLLRMLRYLGLLSSFPVLVNFVVCVTSILLGFMFGMPQIAKWLPGDGRAEQKGLDLAQKLGPYQVIIGVIGLIAALLALLSYLHILTIV